MNTATSQTSTKPNTMTGLAGWVEVFRAGAQTDSKGRELTFSRADLDQMMANHALGPAPAVIGHPKDTAPAYAHVDEYKRDGDRLFCRFTKINPAFEAGVKSGAYFNRSLGLCRDKNHGWRVQHVGWLGGVPPAIDGLEPVTFAAAEEDTYDFSAPGRALAWSLDSVATLFRGMREQIIAKDGIEAADAALPQWAIENLQAQSQRAQAEFDQVEESTYSNPNAGDVMTTFTKEQLEAALAEQREKDTAQFSAQSTELVQLRTQQQATRLGAQIEKWKGAVKVLPAEAAGMVEFMAALEGLGTSEFNFSAHDGAAAKKTPLQFFTDFVDARTPVVKTGSQMTQEGNPEDTAHFNKQDGYSNVSVDSERLDRDKKIRAYAAQHKVSYDAAAAVVMAG